MISDFINSKMNSAVYKILADKTYFGEIKGLRGVWANSRTLEMCRRELREVLEDWLVVKLKSGDSVAGLSLRFDKRKEFSHA